MTTDTKGRFILMVLGIFTHLSVLADFWWGPRPRHNSSWAHSFTFVVLFMMTAAALTPFIKTARTQRRIFGTRFLATAVVAIPYASHPGSFGLIYALIAFEGFVYLAEHLAWVPGACCILLSAWWAHLQMPLWSGPADPVDWGALMVTWSQCALSAAVGYLLAREHRLRAQECESLQGLLVSNTELADSNMNLQKLAAQVELTTTIKERSRMAREIHDELGYILTNLMSLLDVYREKLQARKKRVPEEIVQARVLAREGLGHVRIVLQGLRPRSGEGYNGLGNVKRLVDVFGQATGMRVVLSYGDAPQFPGEVVEAVLYRAVQEGLTNAFRHGHATEVFVTFHHQGDGIELIVRDNGRGTTTFTGGLGLLGITERVEELGGSVMTVSQSGCGFSLRIWLPFIKEVVEDGSSSAGDR